MLHLDTVLLTNVAITVFYTSYLFLSYSTFAEHSLPRIFTCCIRCRSQLAWPSDLYLFRRNSSFSKWVIMWSMCLSSNHKVFNSWVIFFASEKTSLQGVESLSLFDQSYKPTNPKSVQVLWARPVADGKLGSSMQNHLSVSPGNPTYTEWDNMGFFKDFAEKTGNSPLSLTTNSILPSSISLKHPYKTWHLTRGQRKEALSQQASWRPASASPSRPVCNTAEIKFQTSFL